MPSQAGPLWLRWVVPGSPVSRLHCTRSPDDALDCDGITLYAYRGHWAIGAQLTPDGDVLGKIGTAPEPNPEAAMEAVQLWIKNYCDRNGLTLLSAENLNRHPRPSWPPYSVLARFTIARKRAETTQVATFRGVFTR
ncbi:hypothetical protein [Streptomyces gobiensis]|uniref:hypothetical protein n=1 Tax=Streptomyces gobiensis TaxID=2875706 RepID=UPI001E431187|nr:hypothetical protein [Streptomyces gobiensis]UGY92310.1 hypothetical protein test1122_11580 [Streptomyces gobiensis]